jgi:hypothetical protein
MLSVGPDGSHRLAGGRGLFPVFILVGIDLREAGFGNRSRCSLQTLPKDLVVELGWNAVFTGEVEAAGFLRSVLRVMSRLQGGTGSKLHLRWIQSKCGRLEKRRCHGFEGPLA